MCLLGGWDIRQQVNEWVSVT